jgi:hypothetical protein
MGPKELTAELSEKFKKLSSEVYVDADAVK